MDRVVLTRRGTFEESRRLRSFLALTIGLLLLTPAAAHATTFNVTKQSDTNDGACNADCSLREAIVAGNASDGAADTINVPAGTYTLSIPGIGEDSGATGDLDINSTGSDGTSGKRTIVGQGARRTIVDANGIDRVFDIDDGERVDMRNLALVGGNSSSSGGAIDIDDSPDAQVNLRAIAIRGNRTTDGQDGGGIDNDGELTITDSEISGNTADDEGGGIELDDTLELTNSTISGNTAAGNGGNEGDGGGISNDADDVDAPELTAAAVTPADDSVHLTVLNSTIANNTAADRGGGVSNEVASQELGPVAAVATFKNTIVANNAASADDNCETGEQNTSEGNNLENGTDCEFDASGDRQNVDPRLGPLANNGGQTNTHALLARSPAIDRGDNAACPPTDQRGVARPQDGDRNGSSICDIGAFELRLTSEPPRPTPTQGGGDPCGPQRVTVRGTSGADNLVGTPGRDVIFGGSGDDTIRARGGNDIVCGESGDDEIAGGPGDDRLDGASGDDEVLGQRGADRVWGFSGNDLLLGGAAPDALFGEGGADRLDGGGGSDRCVGGPEADRTSDCER